MTNEEEEPKKSNKSSRLAFSFILALGDFAAVTILFGHLTELKLRLLIDFYNFDAKTSLIEFWVLGLTRTCILLGVSFGLLKNALHTRHRCAKWSWLALTFATVSWVYMMTKMLMYTEYISDLKQPWFWSLFGWSCLANVLFAVSWKLIGSLTLSQEETAAFSVNSEEEGKTPLIKEEKEEEDEDDKVPDVSKSKTVGRLLKYTLPDLPLLLIAMIFMCLSSTASIFLPYYTGEVINQITIEKSKTKFVRSIVIMSLLSAGSSVAAGIRGGFFKVCMAKLHIRICNILFGALTTQEIGFYDKKKTGEITSRLTSDTDTVSQVLTLNMNIFLRSMIQAVGTCVFMFSISWRLSMVTFMGLPLITAVSNLYGDYYKNLQKKVQDTLADANSVAEEACSTMRTVRSFANEFQEAICYRDKLQKTYGVKRKEAVAYAGYMWCSELFSLSLVVATLYYGGHLVVNEKISGGNLISFILYQMQLGNVLQSIAWVYSGLMQAVGASEKVFSLIDREPKINHDAGIEKPDIFKGHIRFQDVSFNYPTRPDNPVLKDMSFEVKPGEVVALVGPSGGGKSTCVSLLEHFYQVQNGQITIDGIPIQEFDHKYLHQQISLVGQEPVLYARSIEKNIAYGLDDWELPQVETAARMANAHNFISEMKDGYQTEAGEKGTQLSGTRSNLQQHERPNCDSDSSSTEHGGESRSHSCDRQREVD